MTGLALYRAATAVLGPAISLYLGRRKARGKEDPVRFPERRGIASRFRPKGKLVWMHGASVGEALSMLPLIEKFLARKGVSVLVTTGTVTSAKLMAERLPKGAFHQYVPVDRLPYVRRFLDHWRPDLVLWWESDFWPNMISEIGKRRLPLILVNGRISDKSHAGWLRFRGFIRALLKNFTLCLGQTEVDRERLTVLGAPHAECLGNLKFGAPPLPADEKELGSLKKQIGKRPIWLAASTHAGEEALVGRVHQRLVASLPKLLTVIVPRHPTRGEAVTAELQTMGLEVSRRSLGEGPDKALYVADTMGELGLFFRLCPTVFMGKSLVPLGGQNPLEPARLGCAILFGPHMGNFTEIVGRMKEEGAALEVGDEKALGDTLARLLTKSAEGKKLGKAALAFAGAEAHVLDRVAERLLPMLEEASHANP